MGYFRCWGPSCDEMPRSRMHRLVIAVLALAMLPGLFGATWATPTAGAYSREGLPIEQLDVPSPCDGP